MLTSLCGVDAMSCIASVRYEVLIQEADAGSTRVLPIAASSVHRTVL